MQTAASNGEGATNGEAIVLHDGTSDVEVQKTEIYNVCRGVAAGKEDDPVERLRIRRLWIAQERGSPGLSSYCPDNGVSAIQLSNVDDVELNNNTITDVLYRGMVINSERTGPSQLLVESWNNIVVFNGGVGIELNLEATDIASDFNVYSAAMTYDVDGQAEGNLAGWRSHGTYADVITMDQTPTFTGARNALGSGSSGVDFGIRSDPSMPTAKGAGLDAGYLESR